MSPDPTARSAALATGPVAAPPMVEIAGVSKRFGDTAAVIDAALRLERGAFLTIVGPSGCGKTTLLRMIAGFETPSEGRILINGADVGRVPAHRRAIGMVFQRLALFPHMTAADNIAYPLRRRGHPRASIAPRVAEMLALVRLDGLGERRPHELSGGQQQRVAIARALSFGPDLLLLDEPLSALDRHLREGMQLEFRRIQQDLGVTTINVTHDQREALVMSDQMVVMNHGRIEQASNPHTVYHQPATRFVAAFLGVTSEFGATVAAADGDRLTLAVGDTRLAGRGLAGPGEAVDCAIRAEHITVAAADAGDAAGPNRLAGTLTQVIFEGDRSAVLVDVPALGARPVSAFAPAAAPLAPGTPVAVHLDPDALFAFRATTKEKEELP
ncbi:MAG: ABC transporter ATP-binding protein [Acuticoccus sp.]